MRDGLHETRLAIPTAASHDALLATILRREASLLVDDMAASHDLIASQLSGSRLLVVGAAGSIGSAFVHQLTRFAPAALHLVDTSENNLVELVRDLRSSPAPLPAELRALPVPLGGPELLAFLRTQPPYDGVLNFAALKHVRSEKDPFSLMHMLHTNVLALHELLVELTKRGRGRVFSVSSDKSVRPENAMGASKALMERVLWAFGARHTTSSARFANVAFSDGSLLHGFGLRLAKRQPLAAPLDVQRYFISHEEAGQLCLLAHVLGATGETFVPRLDPDTDLMSFAAIARAYLESRGLEAFVCESEDDARRRAFLGDYPTGSWPCFFSDSDTTGEKMVEEFVAPGEVANWQRFRAVGVVTSPTGDDEEVVAVVDRLSRLRDSGSWSKEAILSLLTEAVPSLNHVERGRTLDDRM